MERIEADTPTAETRLREWLADADSDTSHGVALHELATTHERAMGAVRSIEALADVVRALRGEWLAATRYEPEMLGRRIEEIAERIRTDARAGGSLWLHELFEAIDASMTDAIGQVAGAELPWPEDLVDGAAVICRGLARWGANEEVALALMDQLATVSLPGWSDVLGVELRSRAHRIAAWLSLRRLNDPETAEDHLKKAIDLDPYAGHMYAERAAFWLFVGDLDLAVTDAQRAIEIAPDDASGYIQLGIWAELNAEYDSADGFYRKALDLLPLYEVERLHSRSSLMDPPGRLLTLAARRLLENKRPEAALTLTARALHSDLRGAEQHPQAELYDIRSAALPLIPNGSNKEAAAAALDAGRFYLWNGDVDRAIDLFERGQDLDESQKEAGWLLADARLTNSLPLGEVKPLKDALFRARDTWDRWLAKVGDPTHDTSWAYLTRAMIADLESQEPGVDRLDGVWRALLYVEKALVHDVVDAQRWGYASQYLRYAGLPMLAFEAAERGYKLRPDDRQVLAERLVLLPSRGEFAAAVDVADKLVSTYGNDPWVGVIRAWLALYGGGEETLEDAIDFLALPIAQGNDPAWYFDLRAQCHVARGELGEAGSDYRASLQRAEPVDGPTKCRLAIAAVAVNEYDQAESWLDQARDDPSTQAPTCLGAEAMVALAAGDTNTAEERLARAVEASSTVVELHETLKAFQLRAQLITRDDVDERRIQGIVDSVAAGPARVRQNWLQEHPATPEAELADALLEQGDVPGSEHEDSLALCALLAVKARRHLDEPRPEGLEHALEVYERLSGGDFEPEATMAVARTLRVLTGEYAGKGDVDEVTRLQDRLSRLGELTPGERAVAVASALESANRLPEAQAELEAAIDDTTGREHEELHQRAGGLALAMADATAAADHFRLALKSAQRRGDEERIGQLEIRVALLSLQAGQIGDAVVHLAAAARHWRQAGVLEPGDALREELRGLLRRGREGPWAQTAESALELVERALTGADRREILERLRRAIEQL